VAAVHCLGIFIFIRRGSISCILLKFTVYFKAILINSLFVTLALFVCSLAEMYPTVYSKCKGKFGVMMFYEERDSLF
jgi:hypothetical protein